MTGLDASTDSAANQPEWQVSAPSAQIAAWLSYQREPKFGVLSSSVRVPMRDGTELACTLARPADGLSASPGKHPGLVMEFTPYYLLGTFFSQEAAFFAARGYNTLFCTLRGIGGSGGAWAGSATLQDRRDAHDQVEWLATQPWSDGRLGIFGESYGGFTTNGAASEQPPHLLAAAPLQSPGSFYDDVNYPGGIEAVSDGAINNWPPIGQLMSLGVVDAGAEYATWHAHQTFDAFWQERSISSVVPKIQVPTLAVGGWMDQYFRAGVLANVEAGLARTWSFYGQWTHTYPVDLETCGGVFPCVEEPLPSGVLLAWFDHWLMQLPNTPIPDQPTFLSEEGPRGTGQGWRQVASWLGHQAPTARLHLAADGSLSAASSSATVRFHEPSAATEPGGSLTFSSPPLERDRVLLGHARLTLRATLSAADANFYVELLDVAPGGEERLVNDGFLKASTRDSKTQPTPVQVGQPVDYAIAIRPQHHRFVAGHRVRLRVSGGPKESLAQPAAVDVEVQTAGSALDLSGWN